jgi:nicotinamidase-related amidase
VRKTKPSVFYGTPFDSHLTQLHVDSLIVCGGTTSGCVRATVVDAFARNLRCAVVADACFDRFETSHAVTLVDLHHKYADVVSSAEALAFLSTVPKQQFNLPGGNA